MGLLFSSLPAYADVEKLLDDGVKLAKDFGIQPGGFVELGGYAHLADPVFKLTYKRKIVSLARMVAMYCDGKVLEKGNVRVGNWEMRPLSEQQKKCRLFY